MADELDDLIDTEAAPLAAPVKEAAQEPEPQDDGGDTADAADQLAREAPVAKFASSRQTAPDPAPVKTGPSMQRQIIDRNKGKFSYFLGEAEDDNPAAAEAETNRLLMTERFLNGGMRDAYLKGDDKAREKIVKNLVKAEAAEQAGDPGSKGYAARQKAIEAKLMAQAAGLADLADFQPEKKADKKKKDDTNDVGLVRELGVGAATGVGQGLAGLVGVSGTVLGLLGGDETDRNVVGRFADGIRRFADDAIADLDKVAENNRSQATKDQMAEWAKIKEEGSNYEIAKQALSSPRMWASQGANMLGMLVPGLGAAGTAARMIGATSKLGKAAVAGTGALAAGGSVAEVDLAKYEKSIIEQGVEKHKEYVGWHDTKALLEAARGKEVPDEEVSKVMARQMRNIASKYDYALSTAVMLVGPVSVGGLGRMLGREAAEGYAGGIVKRAAKGGATEAAQEVGQQYGSNVAREATRRSMEEGEKGNELAFAREAATSKAAFDDLIDSAIMGGLMGAGVGAAQKGKGKPSNDPQPQAAAVDELAADFDASVTAGERQRQADIARAAQDGLTEVDADAARRAYALNELEAGSRTAPFGSRPAPTPEFGSQRNPRAIDGLVEPEAPAFTRRPVNELVAMQSQTRDSASRIAAQIASRLPENPTLRDVEQALGQRYGQTDLAAPDAQTEVLRDQVNSLVFDQIFRQRPRAIDAADPNHVVNTLPQDRLDEIAAGVAEQLADPGHRFVESVAGDTVADVLSAELPDAPAEMRAEVAAGVQDAKETGGVVRAPKKQAKQPDKWTTRNMTDHLLDGARDVELANEIAEMVPTRKSPKKEAVWATEFKIAMEAASKGQMTERHRLVIKADTARRLSPSRLGVMTPAIFTRSKASVGDRPRSHVSAPRVTQIASDYINGPFKDLGLNAIVVRTHSEINPAFGDVPANARAFVHTDVDGTTTIGLVADMLGTEADVRKAIEHEVVGHYKLERVLGEKGMDTLVDKVFAGIGRDPQSRAMWDAIKADYPGLKVEDQVLEFIARAAEQPKDTNGGKVSLNGVKDALVGAGYRTTDAMSLAELKSLLAEVRAVRDPDYNKINAKDYELQAQERIVNPREQRIRPTRLRKMERYLFDRSIDMQFMFRAMGVLNQRAHRMFLALQSDKDRVVNGEIIENHVKPLHDALSRIAEKHGRTLGEVHKMANDWAQAKHAPEVNAWLRATQAKLKSDALASQREVVINNALKGTIDPARARQMLDAIVTDANVDADQQLAAVKYAGMTNAEAAALIAKIPIAADLETLAGPNGELTRLRDVTKKYALSSGHYNRVLTEMAGYDNYVPRKGIEYDARATRPWQDDFSAMNESRGAAEGRKQKAEYGITQLMLEGQLMGARHVNQRFMRAMTETFDRPGGERWGKVSKRSEISYAGDKFNYPERPNQFMLTDFAVSDPDTGATRVLTLKATGVAEVLQNTYKTDDPANAALRMVAAGTRFMGRLYTSLSPSFMVTNVIRDVQGALEAIATEDAKGDPSKRRKFNTDQLKNVSKAMLAAYTSGDMRELFMASAGEREVIVQRWKSQSVNDLLPKYDGDREAAQRAFDMRAAAVEYVEGGGVIGFGRFVDPANTFMALNDLEGGRNVVSRGVGVTTDYMESIGTFLDNSHRLGVYIGLTEMGVPADRALVKARTTSLDFNQRSGMRDGMNSQWLQAAYMFVQPSLTGLHSMVTRRAWRGGEIPLEVVDGPNGQKFQRLKAGWERDLNWPLAAYLAAVGFATTMAASQMMGTDDDGEDRAKKLATGSWFRNHVVAGPGDRPFLLPQQYGMHQIFSNIGTIIALRSLGYADTGELAKEYTNVVLQNTVPGVRVQAPEGSDTVARSLLAGITPSLLQPISQVVWNRNAFGQKVYDEPLPGKPKFASDMGRKSTPQAFSEIATMVREAGGPDWQPEIYAHGVQQFGWVGSTLVEIGKWAQGNSDKTLLDVSKIGVRRDFSADGYEARQYRKFLEETHDPLVKAWERAKLLDAEDGGMKQARGKKRTIGPREQAFLDANPEAPAVFKTKRAFDEAGAVINQAAQQAKSKGDGEKAAAIRDVRKGLVNEFLLRQKEGRLNGAAQDFDRFVRDRISGL